jgi:Macrocin-O-methyltransferase (TylF)
MSSVIDNFRALSFVQRVIMLRQSARDYGRQHPRTTMLARAHAASVDFIEANMPDALGLDTPKDLLTFAVSLVTLPGLVLEFGVNAGGTIRHLAKLMPDRKLHGFDSFEGLPEAWSGNNLPGGAFSRSGKLPSVPSNVTLHKGWFNDTLPGFVAAHKDAVAFLHVDCDIYSSTKTIFDGLAPQIVPGTVIVFDEFFNYPNWQAHEYRAFMEFLTARDLGFRYTAYAYEQVAGVITDKTVPSAAP